MAKSPDAFRTIREVAEWLDTPAHVLRFWESKFSQIKPVKRAGGRRYYRPADMLLLGGIKQLLHDDGLTIKGVNKMLRSDGAKAVSARSQPLDDDLAALAAGDVIEGDVAARNDMKDTAQPVDMSEEVTGSSSPDPAPAPSLPTRDPTPDQAAPAPTQEPPAQAGAPEPAADPAPVVEAAQAPEPHAPAVPFTHAPPEPAADPAASAPEAVDPAPAATQPPVDDAPASTIPQLTLPPDPSDDDVLPAAAHPSAPVLIRLLETPDVRLNAGDDQLSALLGRMHSLRAKMSDQVQG